MTMRYLRRGWVLLIFATLPFGLTGCISGLLNEGGFIEFFLRGIGVGGGLSNAATVIVGEARTPKIRESIPVQLTGSIGGLDGTFDVTVGSYGTLTGTAEIKGQKKAAIKIRDDEQAASLVEAIVLDRTGEQVDVTETKTKFKGSQTTGGVKKKYKAKIIWKGTVMTGASVGTAVRGKIKTKGSF